MSGEKDSQEILSEKGGSTQLKNLNSSQEVHKTTRSPAQNDNIETDS